MLPLLLALSAAGVVYPAHPNVIDVTKPPYSAKADGVADDTDALQRALDEHVGRHHVLYFPAGTYLVSKTLTWKKKVGGRDNWGFTTLQGFSAEKCVIRLKDATFADPKTPKAIMWCGGFGSADWFHNHVRGLTFHVGKGNPGAVALQFYSNNYGAVRDCRFVSGDGGGAVGLDLGHRDMNGPLLVQRVKVEGFRVGVACSRSVNSQTLEHVELSGQTEFGIDNHGQPLTIRGLKSELAVPALRTYGTACLIDATLTGTKGAEGAPAVVNYNGGRIHLRDVVTSGYLRALGDVNTPDYAAAYRLKGEDKKGSLGPKVPEYFSHAPTRPFGGEAGSLRLKIEETPDAPQDDPKTWAVVDAFGADPSGKKDSTAAIQKALDSGSSTVFLPGHYAISKTLVVPGKVRRIVGCGGQVNYGKKLKPDFRVGGAGESVTFEHFATINGGVEIDSRRTVVLKSVGAMVWGTDGAKGGKLFLDDVAGHELRVKGMKVYARQLNIENEGTHLLNDGGEVWVLGYKTERGGTLAETRNAGRTEILGGFSYTTTAGKVAPMFVTADAEAFAFFGEVCYTGDPFKVLIREERRGSTKTIARGEGHTWPYVGR